MCAIIGASIKVFSYSDLIFIKRLFLESQIRGKHATGISFVSDGKIITESYPVPASEFIEIFDWSKLPRYEVRLVGHCRYSTSDLEYNQPIATSGMSIVHNGVISQEEPENWEEQFGYSDFETRNDSELLLKACQKNIEDPLLEFPDASIAACVLLPNNLFAFRNGKRPLYAHLSKDDDNVFFTSTKDIMTRTDIYKNIQISTEAKPMHYYFDNLMSYASASNPTRDLQQNV